jgi:hypothetical protein
MRKLELALLPLALRRPEQERLGLRRNVAERLLGSI